MLFSSLLLTLINEFIVFNSLNEKKTNIKFNSNCRVGLLVHEMKKERKNVGILCEVGVRELLIWELNATKYLFL